MPRITSRLSPTNSVPLVQLGEERLVFIVQSLLRGCALCRASTAKPPARPRDGFLLSQEWLLHGGCCLCAIPLLATYPPLRKQGSAAPYSAAPPRAPGMDSCFRRNGCYTVAVACHVTTPAKAGVYRSLLCRHLPAPQGWIPAFAGNGCYTVAAARVPFPCPPRSHPAKAGVYRPLLCGAPPPLDSCFRRNGCYTVEAAPLTTPLQLVWFDKLTTNGVGKPPRTGWIGSP